MLRFSSTLKQVKGHKFKHNAGYELNNWNKMKRARVRVQHLLSYERIEVNENEANVAMRYTDALLNICKKGPRLEALPPRFITENHLLPTDAQNYKPEDFAWKQGAEYWGYDTVHESDRRFGKSTKNRDQSIEQYTRDMLDWWTEGPHQEILQYKIYNTLLPRYEKRKINSNRHTKWAKINNIYYETRRSTDGLPTYKGGPNDGGRFNAGTLAGWHGAGHGEVCVVELMGNCWPPLPTLYEDDEKIEGTFLNRMLNTAFPDKIAEEYRYAGKEERGYEDSISYKDTGVGKVR